MAGSSPAKGNIALAEQLRMRRRIWLAVLVLYATGGVSDGAYRRAQPPAAGSRPSVLATLPVARVAAALLGNP